MTVRDRDPATLTVAERLGEIAAILAAAYLRLQAARFQCQMGLDASRDSEAQCAPQAQSPKSEDHAA